MGRKKKVILGDYVTVHSPYTPQISPSRYPEEIDGRIIHNDPTAPSNVPARSFMGNLCRNAKEYGLTYTQVIVEED